MSDAFHMPYSYEHNDGALRVQEKFTSRLFHFFEPKKKILRFSETNLPRFL